MPHAIIQVFIANSMFHSFPLHLSPQTYIKIMRVDFLKFCELFFSVEITEDGMKAILQLSQGDMRKSLNILQSTHMAFGVSYF